MSARHHHELPPTAWLKNTGYQIDLAPLPFRVRAEVAGETVLDSRRALVMYELGHAAIYYIPSDDVRRSLLKANDHSTFCPYKGDAGYWDLTVGDRTVENAVWAYGDPYPRMASLAGLMGVYWDRMDRWFHDDDAVDVPLDIDGRINHTNNFAKRYPDIAKQWHRERNGATRPYEYAADDKTPLWWLNDKGEEWQASIMDRVAADGP